MIEGHFEKYSMTFTGLVMGNVFSNSMTRMNSRLVLCSLLMWFLSKDVVPTTSISNEQEVV